MFEMDILNIYSVKKQIEKVMEENKDKTDYMEDYEKIKCLDTLFNDMDSFNQTLFLNWVKGLDNKEEDEFFKSGLVLTMAQLITTFKLDIKKYDILGMDRLSSMMDEYEIKKYPFFEKIVRDITFILESDNETLEDAFFVANNYSKGDISTPLAHYNAFLEGKKL